MVEVLGAFVCLGLILAGMNFLNAWQARRKGLDVDPHFDAGCSGCTACKGLEKIVQQKKLERLTPAPGAAQE